MSNLTNQDHNNMDAYLGYLLDAYKSGKIEKTEAIGDLAHVIAAIDQGNINEAREWFKQSRKELNRS